MGNVLRVPPGAEDYMTGEAAGEAETPVDVPAEDKYPGVMENIELPQDEDDPRFSWLLLLLFCSVVVVLAARVLAKRATEAKPLVDKKKTEEGGPDYALARV